jgi:hypothetical protein
LESLSHLLKPIKLIPEDIDSITCLSMVGVSMLIRYDKRCRFRETEINITTPTQFLMVQGVLDVGLKQETCRMLHFVAQSAPHVTGEADFALYPVIFRRRGFGGNLYVLRPESHSALVSSLQL